MELHIRDVSKTYSNGAQALKDATLTIPAAMFGLFGPNGVGKSPLMRTITTLHEPDEGRIRLGDIDVRNQMDEVRKTLGYLPQEIRRLSEGECGEAARSLRITQGHCRA